MRRGRSLEEKFWEKVDKRGPDECWPWLASVGPSTERGAGGVIRHYADSYGHMGVWRDGRWKTEGAHRISYMLATGEWPGPGKHVAHRCDVRRCVNPTHLFLTDNDGNIADKVAKGRQTRGEKMPWHKLTEEKVREIKRLLATGVTHADLRRQFGVSDIADIASGRIWKHVA